MHPAHPAHPGQPLVSTVADLTGVSEDRIMLLTAAAFAAGAVTAAIAALRAVDIVLEAMPYNQPRNRPVGALSGRGPAVVGP
jgi:hypothetical protein